ncbi:MAG: hypothetical protein HC936_07155 [Leptolyngbyaceae cyanobacterium SU_3_3]|nr:hypothetical protein [Leptolyngbyaceae cyanobacterium SU_3_3]NJR53061.1 hypothetical protein [Leptolyngbyaceae cyanobacterium CSU_1_3]
MAYTNDRGLILNGVIEFSVSGATIFYWIMTALSATFVVFGMWTIFTTLVHGIPDVMLAKDSISFPVGFPIKRAFTLPFSEITGFGRSEINGQRFLYIQTLSKKYHIVLNWLATKGDELELLQELTTRLTKFGADQRAELE